jgi:hypothetical protein
MRGTFSARELAALGPPASSAAIARPAVIPKGSRRLLRRPRSRERGVETSEGIRRRSTAVPSHRCSRRNKDLTASLTYGGRLLISCCSGAGRHGKPSARHQGASKCE